MLSKKVSIIVPYFNAEKTIENCIRNLQIQNYENKEIILIDDCSTDDSKEIVKKYLHSTNLKYYFIQKQTIGVGYARNYGIEKATGKYIMFVDADDYIECDLLEKLKDYIEQDIELIKYNLKIREKRNRHQITREKTEPAPNYPREKTEPAPNYPGKNGTGTKLPGQDIFNEICFKDKYLDSPCLYLIKKELIERTKLEFEKDCYHEDFGMIPQLIVNAKTMVIVDYEGYIYNQTENSIMRNDDYQKKIKKIQDKIILYDKMVENIKNFELKKITVKNLKQYYTNSIILSLKDLNVQDRKKFIKEITHKKMYKNIQITSIKQLIKKVILKLDVNVYLKYIVSKKISD